jgi:6-phosphogluconolactonase
MPSDPPPNAGAEARVHVLETPALASAATADLIEARIGRATSARGRCLLVLAGGSTPKRVYELLAASPRRERIPWGSVQVFFGDERCVPPDDEHSNFRMAEEALLTHVPLVDGAVHRIPGELGGAEAARRYAEVIRGVVPDDPPVFDVVLLGLGYDGHTASLFPGDTALEARDALVAVAHAPAPPTERVTLTLPLLCAARSVAFLALGEAKADAVRRMLAPASDPAEDPVPAARVWRGAGDAHLVLDRGAASAIS